LPYWLDLNLTRVCLAFLKGKGLGLLLSSSKLDLDADSRFQIPFYLNLISSGGEYAIINASFACLQVARIILFVYLFTHLYFRYDQVYVALQIFILSFCTNKLGRAEM